MGAAANANHRRAAAGSIIMAANFRNSRWTRWYAGGLAIVAFWIAASSAGFCVRTGSFPSDTALVDAAIRYELSVNASVEGRIQFSSPQRFISESGPDCCRITRSLSFWNQASPLEALLGQRISEVHLTYRRENGGGYPYYESILLVCCNGQVVDSHGRSLNREERDELLTGRRVVP